MNKIKTSEEILVQNIPDEILNDGYSFGDIKSEWIVNAMKEYAEQFIDLAAREASIRNIPGVGNLKEVSKESIFKIKKLIK